MIFAAVGKNASGKDFFLEYLADKYDMKMLSIGDVARELAEKEGLEKTRENLHHISQKYMSEFGNDFFPKEIIRKIKAMDEKHVLVSGIRPLSDVMTFKEVFGEEFFLVRVVVTEDKTRFDRMQSRNSDRDPQSHDKFVEYDLNEEKLFQTSETMKLASFEINNDGTKQDYIDQIEDFYKNIIL